MSKYPLLIAFAWLAFMGCQRGEQASTDRRFVTDALDRRVSVPIQIKRVITLAPGVTEIVAAAGAMEKVVGVTTADNYPPTVEQLPRFSALPVNYEAVAALEPDIIFAATQVNNPRNADVFTTLNIPVIYLASATLEDVLGSIEMVGEILGTPGVASSESARLRRRIEVLAESARNGAVRPTVLFLISLEALHSFGPESYVHQLIDLAGGRSATADLDVRNPILNDEFVLSRNPDIIVGTFGDEFQPHQVLDSHPTWTLVPAVVNGRIFSIESDLVLRAGPRIVDAAEELAAIISASSASE